MRWYRNTYEKTDDFYAGKDKLNEAFKLLRKEKLIARQNFSCCASCGGAEIVYKASETFKKTKKYPSGYVFYHRQDTESLDATGKVFIRYGSFFTRTDKLRKGCLSSVDVGKLLVNKLNEVGLKTDWNGDVSSCVLVDVDGSGFTKEDLE